VSVLDRTSEDSKELETAVRAAVRGGGVVMPESPFQAPDLGVMTTGLTPPTPAQRVMGGLMVFGTVVLIVWTVLAVLGVIDVSA
jgi:hypothetical protein